MRGQIEHMLAMAVQETSKEATKAADSGDPKAEREEKMRFEFLKPFADVYQHISISLDHGLCFDDIGFLCDLLMRFFQLLLLLHQVNTKVPGTFHNCTCFFLSALPDIFSCFNHEIDP